MKTIYTVGYASHTLETFVDVLNKHHVDVVADVRSSPYSQFKADFNREPFAAFLKDRGMQYLFFGDFWGARLTDRSCYVNGQVDFVLASKTENFAEGMTRIKKGIKDFRIALMCAEKDPIACHRGIWLSRQLKISGFDVQHILADGELEAHHTSEIRLLKKHRLNHPDLFQTEEQRIVRSYQLQAEKVAFSQEESPDDIGRF